MRFQDSVESALFQRNPHLELMRRVPLFSTLDPAAFQQVYRRTTVKRWYGGAIIVGQDEPGTALYLVLQGQVKEVLFGENGREMTLRTMGPGEHFGAMSMVDGKPRSSNVVAQEDVVLLVLSREALMRCLGQHPEMAARLLKELSARIRRSNELITNLALHDVSTRLMRTLVTLAEESGELRDDGVFIRRRPTQQELANMVGTCRETVSRALSAMSRRGLVVSRGRSIFLSRALMDSLQEAA